MIKAQVVRFVHSDADAAVPPESLSEAFRNELLKGVVLSKSLRCGPTSTEPFRDYKVRPYGIEFRGTRNDYVFVAADVRYVLCDFTSMNADMYVVYSRLLARPSKHVHMILFGIENENATRRCAAFWQAWSVPVCVDVRRIVFGFLE